MWSQLEIKLVNWENRLAEIRARKTEDRLEDDRDYVTRELSLLEAEKKSVETRLKKMNELITKVRLLIEDLNEDLCHEFSGGRSQADVKKALLVEFGRRLEEDYRNGRRRIREFLEKNYHINKAASRDLFSLLEEEDTISYQVNLPGKLKYELLMFSGADGNLNSVPDPGKIYEFSDWWEIRA